MTDIKRIEDAFLKADKAAREDPTNKQAAEDARILADAIRQQRQAPPAPPSTVTAGQSFKTGAQDPLYGAAQITAHIAPEWMGTAANELTDAIDSLLGKEPRPGVSPPQLDQNIQQRERTYQASRGADAGSFDPWRLGGNIAGTLPFAAAVPGATSASLLARTGASALGGGLAGGIQPVTGGDYGQTKARQVGWGALGGGLTTGGLGLMGKAWRSTGAGPAVNELWREGIRPTIGQTLGGAFRTLESKATSIPFLGGLIRHGERKGLDQFRRALYNRALRPIGEALGKKTDAARGGLREVYDKVTAAYDRAVPKAGAVLDNVFNQRMGNLVRLAQNMEPGRAKQFMNIVQTELRQRVSRNGHMTGDSIKTAISQLKRQGVQFGKSLDYDQRQLGDALKQVSDELSNLVARQHPQIARQIKAADKSYGLLLQLEKAATYIGANKGEFTPAQYLRAVQAMDSSLRKRAFAHGGARDQRFAETAKDILAAKYPDTGTSGRNQLGAYLAGGGGLGYAALTGHVNPALAAAAIAGPPAAAAGYGLLNTLGPGAIRNLPQAGRYLAPGLATGSGLLAGGQ